MEKTVSVFSIKPLVYEKKSLKSLTVSIRKLFMVIQPLKIKSDFYQGWHFSNLEPPSSEIARRRHVILKYVSRIPFTTTPPT